ncbi:MAG: S8 family peptidase [Flavobacteriales bacterium]|nr:S8 family peptidase [Flavobacteriales bacterium]
MRLLVIILILLVNAAQNFSWAQSSPPNFLPNTVIFKVKTDFRSLCRVDAIDDPAFNRIIQSLGTSEVVKKFPRHSQPRTTYNIDGLPLADLSLIYQLTYSSNVSIDKVIRSINNLPLTEYTQKHYLPRMLYTPNDNPTDLNNQYHLDNIQAFAAWDIEKGDTNVVIGITDTGVDTAHIDLVGNLKYNYLEVYDGVDNDNDGYIDNYQGWDMGDNDNDPSSSGIAYHHGTSVAGLAAASTNNGIQGAGVGFKCKFLPIKCNQDNEGFLRKGYEGIVYAVDHGCQIINCSWGDTSSAPRPFEQEIVNYATLNNNVLVIAAAGNSNNQSLWYPASLKYVISVGGTDSNDVKYTVSSVAGSSYGRHLDLSAPAHNIFAPTVPSGIGNVNSGTSYAAPIVAGCAALVKSRFPNYTALQIGEQLRVTADNIDMISGNAAFQEKLGSGRVNLFKAVTDTSRPSVVMITQLVTDGNDEIFNIGDTISVEGIFKNYLAPTAGVSFASISSTNPNITFIQSVASLGMLGTLDTVGNFGFPLMFTIDPTVGSDELLELRLEFNDTSLIGYEYMSIMVNPSYVDIEVNNISTSMIGQTRIGFEDSWPLENRTGLGFQYRGEQMIFEAGLMVGAQIGSSTFVSDNIWDFVAPDADFVSVTGAKAVVSTVADIEANCVVNDDGAGADTMKISVDHTIYAWSNSPDEDYILLKYDIINTGSDTLMNLYAGINADWDIWSFQQNTTANDFGTRMGYVKSTEGGSPYAGIKLLSNGPYIHYAIDNYAGAPGIDIFGSSFSSAKKYIALSTNKLTAGTIGSGNDVIDVVSTGPFNLMPQDTLTVSFAMLAGNNLLDLVNAANAAQAMYDTLFSEPDPVSIMSLPPANPQIELYPNPSEGEIVLSFSNITSESAILQLFDMAGHVVFSLNIEVGTRSRTLDISTLKAGIYQYRVRSSEWERNGKLVLVQ